MGSYEHDLQGRAVQAGYRVNNNLLKRVARQLHERKVSVRLSSCVPHEDQVLCISHTPGTGTLEREGGRERGRERGREGGGREEGGREGGREEGRQGGEGGRKIKDWPYTAPGHLVGTHSDRFAVACHLQL